MDGWIVVPSWDKFQHYKDREPVWIKLYLELRNRDDWCDLSWTQRGLLISVWMEFGASRGVLRASSVSQRCRQKARRDTLDSLVAAGFITISASKPLALARSREDIDLEEDKKPLTRPRANPGTPKPKTAPAPSDAPRQNVIAADPFNAIAAMIRNGAIQDELDLDAEIRGYHLDEHLATELHQMLE